MYRWMFFLFFLTAAQVHAQQWKAWTSGSLNLDLSKKTFFNLGALHSFNMDDPSHNFQQFSGQLGRRINKKTSLSAGSIVSISNSQLQTRFYTKYSLRSILLKKINWTNAIQGEWHSKVENNYRYRIIGITRIANKKRFSAIQLTASLSYWFYYNIGGDPIRYFNEEGQILKTESPDGFHRGRFIASINSKVSKHFSVSLFYLNQQEFNLGSSRKMNVINPNTGRILRPFNDYQVVGLSLIYSADLYQKHTHKKSSTNKNLPS